MTLFLLFACTTPSDTSKTDTDVSELSAFFQYFIGTSQTTSPDGKKVYQENAVLVRRQVDPPGNQIVEETWYDLDARVTTLTRQGDTSVFDATDATASFTGTITYTGEEWAWDDWNYDLTLTDGSGRVSGPGSFDVSHWESTKTFYDGKDQATALVLDDLTLTDEAGFDAELPSHTPR